MSRMFGLGPFKLVGAVGWGKAHHPNPFGDLLVGRLEDPFAGNLFEDRTEGVEVPIVVVEKRPGTVSATFRPCVDHRLNFAGSLVIDT